MITDIEILKGLNIKKESIDNYKKNKKINVCSYLSKKDVETLKLLDIYIENELYTEFEFELLEMKLSFYYETDKSGNLIMSENLSNKNVDLASYKKLLDIFYKIWLDSNL